MQFPVFFLALAALLAAGSASAQYVTGPCWVTFVTACRPFNDTCRTSRLCCRDPLWPYRHQCVGQESRQCCNSTEGTGVCKSDTCDPNAVTMEYLYGSPCEDAPAVCGTRCGLVSDGCGGNGVMSCGNCSQDESCISEQCVCDPLPTCPTDSCETLSNACSNKPCQCDPGKTCSGSTCVCGNFTCPPQSCGSVSDSCSNSSGSFRDCGGCLQGEECLSNACVCPPVACSANQECGLLTSACSNATLSCGTCSNASLPNCVNNSCIALPLGPNATVGIPTSDCNVSLFNETAFILDLVNAFLPELVVYPSTVVVQLVECVGSVLEVTFAIHGSTTSGSLPLPPGLSGSVSSSTAGGVDGNGSTWTIISWPGLTTTTSTTVISFPSALANVGDGSPPASSSTNTGLLLGIILSAAALVVMAACAAGLLGVYRRRARRNRSPSALSGQLVMNSVALSAMRTTPPSVIPALSGSRLTAAKLLGSGNFGAVYEGKVDDSNRRIAIKEVFSGSVDDMRREADVLMRCQHEFVVQLLGIVGSDAITVAPGCHPALGRNGGSVCMLTELCEYGSLQDALKEAASGAHGVAALSLATVSASWLYLVLWQVSEAMRFLTCEAKVLHRDLAARNVLLARASDGYTSGLANADGLGICARVSDFGLSESMYAKFYDKQQQKNKGTGELGGASRSSDDDEEEEGGGGGGEEVMLPLRWTAPEALLKHKFSEKSDVYSFGVLMIETLNMGRLPLSTVPTSDLVNKVQSAVQLSSKYLPAFDADKPVPFVAPGTQEPLDDALWDLVLQCVSFRAEDRPTFAQCSHELKGHLATVSTEVFVPPARQALPNIAGASSKFAAIDADYGSVARSGAASDAGYGSVVRTPTGASPGAEYGTVARVTESSANSGYGMFSRVSGPSADSGYGTVVRVREDSEET